MTEYLLKKQGEGSLQAAVSGYGKLEIQSKTQNDLGQIDRLDLLKKGLLQKSVESRLSTALFVFKNLTYRKNDNSLI